MGAIPSLRTSRDFRRVYQRGRRGRSNGVAVVAATSEPGPTRLGIAVPGRSGNAVERNRIKRRVREAFRASGVGPNLEIVVRTDREALGLRFQELTKHLETALSNAGALQR